MTSSPSSASSSSRAASASGSSPARSGQASGRQPSEKLLALRKQMKQRKPNFVVKSSHYSVRVSERWRYPRGRHSPIRQMHRGKPPLVRIGYGMPRSVRGWHRLGLRPVVVASLAALRSLQKGTEGAVLLRTLGNRKRAILLEAARQEGIPLLNVRDIPKALEQIKGNMAGRKKARQEHSQQKKEKQSAAEKQEEQKEKKKREKNEEKSKKEEKSKENVQESSSKGAEPLTHTDVEREQLEKTITKRQ